MSDSKRTSKDGQVIWFQFLNDEIIEKTIKIRRAYEIKLPHALIAATTIIFDMNSLLRNDKNFIQIPELKYINPFTV